MTRLTSARLRRPLLAVAATALAFGGLTACGSDDSDGSAKDNTKISTELPKGVTGDKDEFTVSDGDTTTSFGENGIEIPDDFPEIPLPETSYTVITASNTGEDRALMLTADEFDLDAEKEHLIAEATAAGYTTDSDSLTSVEGGGYLSLVFTGSEYTLSYALTNSEDGGTAMISARRAS